MCVTFVSLFILVQYLFYFLNQINLFGYLSVGRKESAVFLSASILLSQSDSLLKRASEAAKQTFEAQKMRFNIFL
jgi:hypothetical protein